MRKNEILVKFFVNPSDSLLSDLMEEPPTTFKADGGQQVGHFKKSVANSLISDLRESGYGCTDVRWKKQGTRGDKDATVITLTFTSGARPGSGNDQICTALQDRTYHHVYVWDNPGNMTINFVAPASFNGAIPIRIDQEGNVTQS